MYEAKLEFPDWWWMVGGGGGGVGGGGHRANPFCGGGGSIDIFWNHTIKNLPKLVYLKWLANPNKT